MGNTGRQCGRELLTSHIQYFQRRVVGMAGRGDKNKWNSFQYFTKTEAGQWVTSVELFTRKLLSSSSSRPHHHHCKDSEQLLTALTSFPRAEQCSLHYLHSASACISCGADDTATRKYVSHILHILYLVFLANSRYNNCLYLQISHLPRSCDNSGSICLHCLGTVIVIVFIIFMIFTKTIRRQSAASAWPLAAKTRVHTLPQYKDKLNIYRVSQKKDDS